MCVGRYLPAIVMKEALATFPVGFGEPPPFALPAHQIEPNHRPVTVVQQNKTRKYNTIQDKTRQDKTRAHARTNAERGTAEHGAACGAQKEEESSSIVSIV
jgi:hypothetical protein